MKKLIYLIPFILFGCTMTQKISYKTDALSYSTDVNTIPIMVDVQILADNRGQNSENDILFNNPRNISINKKSTCINSEKNYKKDSVSTQITRIMVDHFNKARLFNIALCNNSPVCDYYLTATLNTFYGEQKFSTAALVGSQFGLLGALATASAKTDGKIIIDISDIKLFKKDGTLIKDMGDFYKEYEEEMPADANCWCIYGNINEKLKDYNSHLIEKIRNDLAGIQFN